jgi:hypothetical protein
VAPSSNQNKTDVRSDFASRKVGSSVDESPSGDNRNGAEPPPRAEKPSVSSSTNNKSHILFLVSEAISSWGRAFAARAPGVDVCVLLRNGARELFKLLENNQSANPESNAAAEREVRDFLDKFANFANIKPDDARAILAAACEPSAPETPSFVSPSDSLEFINPATWEGQPVPEREWLVGERIPVGNVCLLSGDGAIGKTTIALQLAAAIACGARDWLGAVVEKSGPVIFFSAEEDAGEVHRRLTAVVGYLGISFSNLAKLQLLCMPGEDAVLGLLGKDGMVHPTPLLCRLEVSACRTRPALIVIEAAAEVFAGKAYENVFCVLGRYRMLRDFKLFGCLWYGNLDTDRR